MSFMDGLKSFGHTLLHVAPAVLPFIPGMPPQLVGPVQAAILDAQGLEPVDGETSDQRNARQKEHALALTRDAIVTHNLAVPANQQIDPESAMVAVSEGIDATVRSVKVVHQAKGKAQAAHDVAAASKLKRAAAGV